MIKRQEIEEELRSAFPGIWLKEGNEWDGNDDRVFWSGEGSVMPDGNAAFNYWSENYDLYPWGIHKDLVAWSKDHGIFWEPYDPGTWFAFEA